MKRKTFLIAATGTVLAAASVPAIWYYTKGTKKYDPLIMPDELGHFCDEKTIREIGLQYRKLMPQEGEKTKLQQILLTDSSGKLTPVSDKFMVMELLDKKILEDFKEYKIYILNGWVISETEARQCALFSLT